MRPVKKGADPPYTSKTTFKFNGANRTAVRKFIVPVSGQGVFAIADCLTVWLGFVKNDPLPPGATISDARKAVAAIKNQVNNLYKLASVPMTQRLGPFCSYCETPLAGLLEVEHCVPKSNYPTYSTSWKNFLLSCGPCNNAKGDTPNRGMATGWTGKPNPTEANLYDEIRTEHYMWPDLDIGVFKEMPHVLQGFEGGVWKTIGKKQAIDIGNIVISTDISTRTVIARIYDGSIYKDLSVRVVVQSGTTGLIPDIASEAINLCKLNDISNTASTYDRRMMNRTLAWFKCLKSLQAISIAKGDDQKLLMFKFMQMMAASAGFYSVWIWLLYYVVPLNVVQQFLTDTNAPPFFPNTNIQNMLP